jgi:thiosulfate/3-mercaptopyruvate sulfurtransferase
MIESAREPADVTAASAEVRMPRAVALFAPAGLTSDRTAVVYCTSGTRSSQTYLTFRLLGHARIRNYDGSWMEWATTPALPVAR